jgi:general secretion pathway protein G
MPATRPSGFTLIEILMAVSVVAIVAAVSVPRFIDYRNDAKAAVTTDTLNSIKLAITGDARTGRTGYLSHMGAVPTSLNDLVAQGTQPAYDPINKIGWNGPYLDTSNANWNKDGWGTAIQYTPASRTLRSCGPNANCGDADDIVVTF